MEGKTHWVNSYHSQTISVLGSDMMPLAVDQSGNIEAFKHCSKQIYGIVWHPERMTTPILPTDVANLIKGKT
jgi:putative glutamine amidotransferase